MRGFTQTQHSGVFVSARASACTYVRSLGENRKFNKMLCCAKFASKPVHKSSFSQHSQLSSVNQSHKNHFHGLTAKKVVVFRFIILSLLLLLLGFCASRHFCFSRHCLVVICYKINISFFGEVIESIPAVGICFLCVFSPFMSAVALIQVGIKLRFITETFNNLFLKVIEVTLRQQHVP